MTDLVQQTVVAHEPPHVVNAHGQAVGPGLPAWEPRPFPPREPMVGQRVRLEPLDPARHGAALCEVAAQDGSGATWTYLPYGPFASSQAYADWLASMAAKTDPQFYAIVDTGGRPLGLTAYMRIDPLSGVLEIGHLYFGPALQRTAQATEAIVLQLRRAFDELGYRRVEWKCDALNARSRRAAQRFGFRFEGLFRQHIVVKGRNRDTAWFSIVDSEWPALREAFDAWLRADNFDEQGRQRRPLRAAMPARA